MKRVAFWLTMVGVALLAFGAGWAVYPFMATLFERLGELPWDIKLIWVGFWTMVLGLFAAISSKD